MTSNKVELATFSDNIAAQQGQWVTVGLVYASDSTSMDH